ncbi:4'-phosphopantetheinyl transferase [Oryzihumus leptocrescens]|uniref:4'-phosphopantetheinyl transferase n=2 Tax=Oryzihumus leptocrescens TaxID=297536 RepID=A0A542ZI84_9MICO|nr:4'-phosphopantetheinyl transferase [Oryzihumus leptocrescens]
MSAMGTHAGATSTAATTTDTAATATTAAGPQPRTRPPAIPLVQVWWSRVAPLDAVAQWLDERDLTRVVALHRADDRARSATGRALLRLVASRLMEVPPEAVRVRVLCPLCGSDRHGRPVVTAVDDVRPPQVSVAHAGDRVVVALATCGPVGVDVERVSATPDGVADVAWSAAERAALDLQPEGRSPHARARVWVRKEAALKATGYGLAVAPSSLTVTTGPGDARVLAWAGHEDWAGCLGLTDLDVGPGYAGCLAVRCDPAAAPQVLLDRVSDAQLRRDRH